MERNLMLNRIYSERTIGIIFDYITYKKKGVLLPNNIWNPFKILCSSISCQSKSVLTWNSSLSCQGVFLNLELWSFVRPPRERQRERDTKSQWIVIILGVHSCKDYPPKGLPSLVPRTSRVVNDFSDCQKRLRVKV